MLGQKRIENASDVVFLPGRVKPLAVVPKAQVLVLAKVVMPIVRVKSAVLPSLAVYAW